MSAANKNRAPSYYEITSRDLPKILGLELARPSTVDGLSVGVSIGLAVTYHGGEVLMVETAKIKGTGQLIITGQLGDVMKVRTF